MAILERLPLQQKRGAMLTPKQHELLMFIHARLNEAGVPPSFDEMKDHLDLKSKSGIHRLITALEERGFIRRLPHRARALEILKLPEDMTAAPTGLGDLGQTDLPPPHVAEAALQAMQVPVMGKIAAGVPISAIQDHNADVSVPPDMLSGGTHYALTVSGDSMIEAGIHDGDTVIIRQSDTASNGEIVVALVDDEEATLKTLWKRNGQVELEAANPAYETRTFGPDRVSVQGKLVGLIRKYN